MAEPLLMKVALAAVELSKKSTMPPPEMMALPGLLINEASPAVDVSLNSVDPPKIEGAAPPLLMNIVKFPAVALFLKIIVPRPTPTEVTKFCVVPELFVMPAPLIVNVNNGTGLTVIV